MNKKLIIWLIVALAIIAIILGLLIGLKIDYYKIIPFEVRDQGIYIILDHEPDTVYVNFNNHVYQVHDFYHLQDKTYLLGFTINKETDDKVFCYLKTYRLNYLSYIFKIVFNI